MVFYSSTLEGALVHKNWSSVPLVAFLATKINKEQQLPQKFFLETPVFNGRYTQLTCMSEACQALKYGCQFAFHYLQTAYFYHLWNSCIPTFIEKHFPWKFKHYKDIGYQQQIFP